LATSFDRARQLALHFRAQVSLRAGKNVAELAQKHRQQRHVGVVQVVGSVVREVAFAHLPTSVQLLFVVCEGIRAPVVDGCLALHLESRRANNNDQTHVRMTRDN